MAARLFQKIIEDVIGSTSEDEDSSEEQSLRPSSRGTDRRRGRDGRSSRERSSSDRSDRRDRDGRRQQQQQRQRSSHGHAMSARRDRGIDEDDDTLLEADESSYDSSAGDEASDWTSATSGTGLSSSVYDRHRRRQNNARVSDKDSRPSRRDRDRERQSERERASERDQRQREKERRRQRENEEVTEQRRIERERQIEREDRHRERKLERELQQREQEKVEMQAALSARTSRRKKERLRRERKQQQQPRSIRTITSDGAAGTFSFSRSGSGDDYGVDDDDETGSLTRAVEDDLRRQKAIAQPRMAKATAKLEQMERHQHHLRHQVAQRHRLKRQLHEAAAVASSSRTIEHSSRQQQHQQQQQDIPSYRQAELDHQRQKRERQESIEKLIENQGGQLVVPVNTAATGGHLRRHSAGRDDVSYLTLPSALEGFDDGSSAGNTGMASPVDGGGGQRGVVMKAIQEESDGQRPKHEDRVDGLGGNGTGRHPWPCDPTAVDYAPKGERAKTRSTSVDKFVASPSLADQPRKLRVARSFDVENTTYGTGPKGLAARSVLNARSFDNAQPSNPQHLRHYSGRGLYAVHERQDELPRPYQKNQPDHQDQQLIEEAQQILSPYYQKKEASEGMQPPPPPPPPPGPPPVYSYGPAMLVHPRSQPPQNQYLHRTNPVSPIKASIDLSGSVQNQTVVPLPSETEPMQPHPPPTRPPPQQPLHSSRSAPSQNRYPPQEVLPPSPAPVTPSPRNRRLVLGQKQERRPSTPDSPTTKAAVVSPDDILAIESPVLGAAKAPVVSPNDILAIESPVPGAEDARKDIFVLPLNAKGINRPVHSISASPERRKGPEGQIRHTLIIDWTRTLWSPCDEDEEDEPHIFASPDYVPYWHRYINNGKDNGLSKRTREALHEMVALQNDNNKSDQVLRCSQASQEESSFTDLPIGKSTQLPRAVDTDVDSTTSNPTSSIASSSSGWQAPDPSMLAGIISEDQRLPPDPPSDPDARTDVYTDALVDPSTATSADNFFNQLAGAAVNVAPPESSETDPADGSLPYGYEDEEGVEVVRQPTSHSDCIPLAASIRDGAIVARAKDHAPHLEDGEEKHDQNYKEGPGKIETVPSSNPDNDEWLEPGKIRPVPSVDPDGDDFVNLHATLSVASIDSDGEMSAFAKDILDVEPEAESPKAEPEEFEDKTMLYREKYEADDPAVGRGAADSIKTAAGEAVVRAKVDVSGLSNTAASANITDLAACGAAVRIQRLFRGVQTRHRLLVQMGIAKRRKWEPRTKTQEQTRIHSDIRRSARSYLRHRALVLDTPGPGSMVLAVRRVCAIKIQRWFINQVEFYRKVWKSINGFQALGRGYIQRKHYKRMLQPRLPSPEKRSLDAFTAVIRIQSWIRSTTIRKAYLEEYRLRFSYTDAQWSTKKEGVRSRIMAVVLASHPTAKASVDGPISTFVTPNKENVASAGPSPASLATAALTDLEATLTETRDLSSSTIPAYCLDSGGNKPPLQPGIFGEEHTYSPDARVAFANEIEDEHHNDMERISNPNSPLRSDRELFSPIGDRPNDQDNRWVDPEASPRFDPSSSVATSKQRSQQETPPVIAEGNISDQPICDAASLELRFVTPPDDLLDSAWDNRGNRDDSVDDDGELSDKRHLPQRSSKLKRVRGRLSGSRFSASSLHDGSVSVGSQISHSSIRSRSSPTGQYGSAADSHVLELHGSSDSTAPHRKDTDLSSPQASPTRSNVSNKEYEDPPLYMDMSDGDDTAGSSPLRAVRETTGHLPVAGPAPIQDTRFASYVPSAQHSNSELQTIESQAITYSNDILMRRQHRRSRHDSADTSNTASSSVEEPFDVRQSAGVVEQTKNTVDSADFFARQQVDTAMEEFF